MPIYPRLLTLPKKTFFLLGPRGSGKTFWLERNLPEAGFIDLLNEERYQSYLAAPGKFTEEVRAINKKRWVVVDEIQRLPNLLNEVHRSIERDHRRFALCGSSARKLKQAGVNLLGGRASMLHMNPLTPLELGKDFELENYLRYGSLPVVLATEDKEQAINDYVRAYLKEEIQAEALIRNLPAFARFLPISAIFHGQQISISSLARDAEAHRTTVNGYVEILEDTLLAYRLPAFSSRLRVRERQHPKLYFVDCGLVRGLKKQSGPLVHEERGPLFEGFIAGFIKAINDYRGLFDDWYYWGPADSKTEVDFVLEKDRKYIAIEVKYSKQIDHSHLKGLRAIAELKGIKRKILVYTGDSKRVSEDGIEVLPLTEFISAVDKGLW